MDYECLSSSGLSVHASASARRPSAGQGIRQMQLVKIDPVGIKPPQAGFTGTNDVQAWRSQIILSRTGSQGHFRANQHLLLLRTEYLVENHLRLPGRIKIGRVNDIDPGIGQ